MSLTQECIWRTGDSNPVLTQERQGDEGEAVIPNSPDTRSTQQAVLGGRALLLGIATPVNTGIGSQTLKPSIGLQHYSQLEVYT